VGRQHNFRPIIHIFSLLDQSVFEYSITPQAAEAIYSKKLAIIGRKWIVSIFSLHQLYGRS